MREVKAGSVIHREGDTIKGLELIVRGSVRAEAQYGSIMLKNGNLMGLETGGDWLYQFTYIAQEDVAINTYPYEETKDLSRMIKGSPAVAAVLVNGELYLLTSLMKIYQELRAECDSFYRFIKKGYEDYKGFCRKFGVEIQSFPIIEELSKLALETEPSPWLADYYEGIYEMPLEVKNSFFGRSTDICAAAILEMRDKRNVFCTACYEMGTYLSEATDLLMNSGKGDFFDLYNNLLIKASGNPLNDTVPIEAAVSKIGIYLQNNPYIDKELLEARLSEYREELKLREEQLMASQDENQLRGLGQKEIGQSFDQILSYAELSEEEGDQFRELLTAYKHLKDKSQLDDQTRKLRKEISGMFYKVYESAFMKSLTDESIPVVLKMFFYYGYVDEELVGIENAMKLYEMAKELSEAQDSRVYTMYTWLKMVYEGKREPSKNEFDMDYPAYLHDLMRNASITEAQEKAMRKDQNEKLKFEIANFFQTTNRVTYGRVTTFCPLLSEHNVLKGLGSMYVTRQRIEEAINQIREVDFSAFYREVLISRPDVGLMKEHVDKEVLPDVILLPNIGIRGIMWQEIADRKKDSPARMAVSIFHPEEIENAMIRMTGEFRWELCRRIQGARWNDMSDPSLTAEYCDYLQFYKKNREISPAVREKIKQALQKAKNRYREVFVSDYFTWIKYEGQSSPRLNKVARGIIFKYCPFAAKIRQRIAQNPIYKEYLDQYDIKIRQRSRTIEILIKKIEAGGHQVPEELLLQKEFIQM